MSDIPLFPLNVVLMPGAPLPLHIFEERYKQMVNECLEQEDEFGMVFADESGTREVGCTAKIVELVEKMLDLAKVTPNDLVMDLGSGDGRNIIAAAKRGARSIGVEYNADMVELSKRNAANTPNTASS